MSRRSLFAHALVLGAALGGMKIALLAASYAAFGVPALVSPATGLLMWFGTLALLVLAAWRLRVRAGGFQPYTRVLLHLCLVWSFGQILFVGFSILLFHGIAPWLLEATVEPMRAIARQLGARAQLPPEQVEAHAASITAATSPFSVGGQLRGLRDGLFPGIALSALIAIPFRSRAA